MRDDEFGTFYEEHARRLWAYIARLSNDRTAADDIVQEAFIRMLQMESSETMTHEHRKNYLYKIAANLVKRRFRTLSGEALGNVPALDSPGSIDESIAVRTALGKLKLRERSLLWLAYVEGLSHREIGAIAGCRENSVRPLLHRAKQKLIALLGGDRREGGELR